MRRRMDDSADSSRCESKESIIFQTHSRSVCGREARGGRLHDLSLCFCFIQKLNWRHPCQEERNEGWAKTGGLESRSQVEEQRAAWVLMRQRRSSTQISTSHIPLVIFFFFIFKHKGSTAAPTADRCHKGSQLLTDSLAACWPSGWKRRFLSKWTGFF